MKIGTAFGSYLKQEHVGDRRVVVTIKNVVIENVADESKPENKPVLYFQGKDLGLVLNKTNADTITEITGTDETDHWGGHQICLYVDPNVSYAGKKTGGIRVMSVPRGDARAVPPPVQQPPTPAVPFEASDDDVPFGVAIVPFLAGLLTLGHLIA